MTIEEFIAQHGAALEAAGEARHNLMLAILAGAAGASDAKVRLWSFGRPGACALQSPGRPVVLGELGAAECRRFAEMLSADDFPGVVGPDRTAVWFADHAATLGMKFVERIPQQILALDARPRQPGAAGAPRPVAQDEAGLFADWRLAFAREATPQDPAPERAALEKIAVSGDHLFWAVDGAPVSVASIGRRTRSGAVINGVYTPPAQRGRGYAAAVTAALVEKGYAEGKSFACLYVDRRNPASNRCYAKLGFAPVCDAWHCVRG